MTITEKIEEQRGELKGLVLQVRESLSSTYSPYVLTIGKLPSWFEAVAEDIVRRSMVGELKACYIYPTDREVISELSSLRDQWEEQLLDHPLDGDDSNFQKQVKYFIRDIEIEIYELLKHYQNQIEVERKLMSVRSLPIGTNIRAYDIRVTNFVLVETLSIPQLSEEVSAYQVDVILIDLASGKNYKEKGIAEYVVDQSAWSILP